MTLLSLFDHSGNASCPYKESGWKVIQVDIKLGIDILTFDYKNIGKVDGIIAMVPCTDYALSGARHFAAKDKDGRTEQSQKLIAKTKEIIDYFSGSLLFWQLENPMSRIHKLNIWLGSPALKFNPCDYAGYDPVPDNSRYNKMTWIWGKFNKPELRRLEPLQVENPGWKTLGGKSERTKELRSITPLGFAYAFYHANR